MIKMVNDEENENSSCNNDGTGAFCPIPYLGTTNG